MHLDTFLALTLALLVKIRLKAKTNETSFAFTTKDDPLHYRYKVIIAFFNLSTSRSLL